jgi:hypothetical protein
MNPMPKRIPPMSTTFLGPTLSLHLPAGNVIKPKIKQQMAKAMAISARDHPNSALRGLIKTLQAYKSIPQVVLLKRPNRRGIHLGIVSWTSSAAIYHTLLSFY